MRLYLKLSKAKDIIPFNYQHPIVGALHKWTGHNNVHGDISLYSLSGLRGRTKKADEGLIFMESPELFISAHNPDFIKNIVRGIMSDPYMAFGMSVTNVTIRETPSFATEQRFQTAAMVLIKRDFGNAHENFFYYHQEESDTYLTETLCRKLRKAGLSDSGVKVHFDRSYPSPKIKAITFKNITYKGSVCPIIVSGTEEQIQFAWNVGIGNSTGIGFGALI